MKNPSDASIAGSVLAQAAWKRVLFSLAILTLLWLAIGWSVAVP
ncbi:hypothetical protein [Pseudomonas syringae]|nr:hypothetical protein [Pseudomonas syringae]